MDWPTDSGITGLENRMMKFVLREMTCVVCGPDGFAGSSKSSSGFPLASVTRSTAVMPSTTGSTGVAPSLSTYHLESTWTIWPLESMTFLKWMRISTWPAPQSVKACMLSAPRLPAVSCAMNKMDVLPAPGLMTAPPSKSCCQLAS